jgi:cytochrome c biogenesis protein CcmG/thiol:disulfide interchange protein DsbE
MTIEIKAHYMSETDTKKKTPLWLYIPLGLFALLAGLFLFQLLSGKDPSRIPSALINRPVPEFALPALEGLNENGEAVPGLSSDDLGEGVTLVNVWASWCGPCRQEHPYLMDLSDNPDINLVGINYKDRPDNALAFLQDLKNPFSRVGVDRKGRTAIDWGVYGVPETFVVDARGVIVYKHIGPITRQSMEEQLLPAIENAKTENKSAS